MNHPAGNSAPRPRPSYETMVWRALRLRCPRCGEGKVYTSWLQMPPACEVCGLRFHRDPGYYLGAVYVNYGITSMITTGVFLIGRFKLGISGPQLLWPLFAFCVIFPLLMFQRARVLWLAFDCRFDSSVLAEPDKRDG